jgi:hypothetical protein
MDLNFCNRSFCYHYPMRTKILTLLILVSPMLAAGEDITDASVQKAVADTQKVLSLPSEREKVIKASPDAAAANKALEQLGGSPEANQQIYELASQIFGNLATEANGDPDKMQKILDQAKQNPAAFAAKFTPAQQAQLGIIANSLGTKLP